MSLKPTDHGLVGFEKPEASRRVGLIRSSDLLPKLLCLLLATLSCAWAKGRKYTPGGPACAKTWKWFYAGDHEPELDDPLIAAGKDMTLPICEAVRHRDMRYRRYAIGALGYIGDRRAVPALTAIAGSRTEQVYFREDALISIYRIDRGLGKELARKHVKDAESLRFVADAIEKDDGWLLAPSE